MPWFNLHHLLSKLKYRYINFMRTIIYLTVITHCSWLWYNFQTFNRQQIQLDFTVIFFVLRTYSIAQNIRNCLVNWHVSNCCKCPANRLCITLNSRNKFQMQMLSVRDLCMIFIQLNDQCATTLSRWPVDTTFYIYHILSQRHSFTS